MPRVVFTANRRRPLDAPPVERAGGTVGAARGAVGPGTPCRRGNAAATQRPPIVAVRFEK